jgi:AcrR family transcriptional regulator
MFITTGLSAVQMQDVAKAVGISRASLYRYYEDKFDLATGVLAVIWEEMNDDWNKRSVSILAEGKTALDRVALYLKKFWLSPRYGTELLFLAEFDAYYSGTQIPENFPERVSAIFADGSTLPIERLLAEGIADGSIKRDTDPHLAGITILNAVRGLQQRVSLRGKALVETDGQILSKMTDELVRLLIAALAEK